MHDPYLAGMAGQVNPHQPYAANGYPGAAYGGYAQAGTGQMAMGPMMPGQMAMAQAAYPMAPMLAQPGLATANPSPSLLSNDRFIKGLLIGAAATYLLTNEGVQQSAIKTLVKGWSMIQGGVEEIKERFQDAEAELHAAHLDEE